MSRKVNGEDNRGPLGVGFKTTIDNQYDVENKRLCNIADPQKPNDVVSRKSLENITWSVLGVLEHAMKKAFANSMLQAQRALESRLNTRIDREHSYNLDEDQHIRTLAEKDINALRERNRVLEIELSAVESHLETFSHNGQIRGIRFKSDWIIQQ